jgi:hypothetical protein
MTSNVESAGYEEGFVPNQPQSFENHAMVVPAYHYVAFGLAGINLLWNLYQTAVAFSPGQLVCRCWPPWPW